MPQAGFALFTQLGTFTQQKYGPGVSGPIFGLYFAFLPRGGEEEAQQRSSTLINTRDTDAFVSPVYGLFRKACNWDFGDESGGHNKYLNVVLTWAEGLCSGLVYTVDYKPQFQGDGKNDFRIRGTYSGVTTKKFRVDIDGTGTPNTFKWSNTGKAPFTTGVAITGDWQALSDGVEIKFSTTTGHTVKNRWTWMAGLGLWVGETLLGFFEEFDSSEGTKDLADHYWHNGSIDQTVDAQLQAQCPLYNDTNRGTCYTYLRLKFNVEGFPQGVQDFFALAQWRLLYDPREVTHTVNDETTWAYSNNAALVALDWVLRRFGMDRASTRVDLDAVEDLANWCVTNGMTFNGEIINEQSPEDTLRDIELCYRGYHFERDGKLILKAFADDAAVMTLTEDDVLSDPESFRITNPGIPETPDRVVAWYFEPLEGYAPKQVYYPDTAGLANESALNEMEINLIGVTDRTKAKQLAKYYYLRAAVYHRTYSMILSPRCYALEPGDCFNSTHPFLGTSQVKLRCVAPSIPQDDGWVRMTAIEENSALYDITVNVGDDDAFLNPGVYTYPPDLTAGTVAAKSGHFKFSWTKIANIALAGYILYAYTSNTPDSGVVIARTSGAKTTETLDLGQVSEDTSITFALTSGTPYYFWITALDENSHESLNKFYLGTATVTKAAKKSAAGTLVDEDGAVIDIAPTSLVHATPAGRTVPSSYFMDLRLSKTSYYVEAITADYIVLHDTSSPWNTLAVSDVSLTNTISGSQTVSEANKRDQASVFSNNSWIHFFIICKSSDGTVASLSSASPTAPTLPTGYDYFVRVGAAYLSTHGVDSASLGYQYHFNGSCFLSAAEGILFSDTGPSVAGTLQTISLANAVPATAKYLKGEIGTTSTATGQKGIKISSDASGNIDRTATVDAANSTYGIYAPYIFEMPVLTAQTLWWTASTDAAIYAMRIISYVDDL